ncbi:LpxI family protein [Meridianimarinicoccus aquatilis]|uniref:LpxI family protein n=2 Tax=Meridianimarinicoccus aquatilis TaxID=2552766 RepID=A0A4R6AVR4_9RHOB|nr:LpxI family protein [Fluviibacterium aquatile]
MSGPVGIMAGSGLLPDYLARTLTAQGRTVVLAEMDGFVSITSQEYLRIPYRVEKLGGLFKALRAEGVVDLVFAGGVARPKLDPAKFDFKTVRLAPRLFKAMQGGDDSTLRVVLDIFEGEGFKVRAAHEMCPDLLPEWGVLTAAKPGERDIKDAARAAKIVAALSGADVGQGAVVAQGMALAVEAAPGTDAMLAYVADVAGACRPNPNGARGVLFKGPKLGQDRRVDLPVIGPSTVEGAARAGLSGIVIEAGGVMILDRAATVAAADAAGLFIWVRSGDGAI